MNILTFGSPQRRLRRLILSTTILPAALAVSAFGATDWNGAVALDTGSAPDDIHVKSNTVVTLSDTGFGPSITENGIFFEPSIATLMLTVNGVGLELRSLFTVLSIANGKTITINGDADFAPGALYTGPTEGTSTDTGIILVKNGGTGKLILDNPTNLLTDPVGGTAKATLRILNGTVSLVGSGGTAHPLSTLSNAIEIGSSTVQGGVLSLATTGMDTTFSNTTNNLAFDVKNNGTIEHVSSTSDTFGSTASINKLAGGTAATNKTLTVNVANGALTINGTIASTLNPNASGGILEKKGSGTLTLPGNVFVYNLRVAEGKVDVPGRLRMPSAGGIQWGPGTSTLTLRNQSSTLFNVLGTTVTVPTGATLEGLPGAFSNSGTVQSTLSLTGGTLNLGIDGASGLPASLAFSNPVVILQESTISATAGASVASTTLSVGSVGKALNVTSSRFDLGAVTLTGGSGTYTVNANTLDGEITAKSIAAGGSVVALVKNGPGTLILEPPSSPQTMGVGSTVSVTDGALGLVIGGANSPVGNATLGVNGYDLMLSSVSGDQTMALPAFNLGGGITARKIGSGVAGTTGTPIRMTPTGNLALNNGTTLNLESADNYVLAMAGGISGNATVNIQGTVETSGVVNLGGPLNVNFASRLDVVGGTVAGGPIVVNAGGTLWLGADDVLGNVGGLSVVNVNGGTVTAAAGTHSALPAVTLNGGTLGATGPGNAPTGPTINYILDGNVTTVPGDTTPRITAPSILLRGDPLNAGANAPVTFTVPRGTAATDLSVTSVIHDDGAGLIKDGDGIMTLSGVNTYTGPTVINAGTVVASGPSSLGDSSVRLNNGGILSLVSPPAFGGFPDVTLNGGATVTNDILTLTTDVGGQSRSAFTNSKFSVGDGFSASFVYTATGAAGPNGLADGITFTLQNNAPTALGGGGGGLGYAGMPNSASLQLNIYLGAGLPIGTALHENGAIQGYISSAPVNLASGNKIKVEVVYNPVDNSFTETLTDLATAAVYTNTFTDLSSPLSNILGGNLAYVGFTGATGGAQAFQTVEDFVFSDSQPGLTLANDITVGAGTTGGLDVPRAGSGVGGAVTLAGALTFNAGSVLNVTGGATATDTPYSVVVAGPTTLAGDGTIDVGNDGNGLGTVRLGDVNQSGGDSSLTKTGAGTLILSGSLSFAVLTTSDGTTNLENALADATVNANGGTLNVNVDQTLDALNIGPAGLVVIGGSVPPALAFDPQNAGAPVQAVPEPSSLAFLLAGALGWSARRQRPPRR